MKHILLILPLLFLVSCGESFEDEYLLCKAVSLTMNGEKTDVKIKPEKYKHTPDAFIELEATPPQAYPFIIKDELGYRYFTKIIYSGDGSESFFKQIKYHPAFRDMETSFSSHYVVVSKCSKAG
jgi:hypothetical protein